MLRDRSGNNPSLIFLSHIEEDASLALAIAQKLESRGRKCWYYERDCTPGLSYLEMVAQAIAAATAIIVIVSPASLGSHQVTGEIVRAYESGIPFIPVLRGITHREFQIRQPVWRQAFGAATSIQVTRDGVEAIVPKLLAGLHSLATMRRHGVIRSPARPEEISSIPSVSDDDQAAQRRESRDFAALLPVSAVLRRPLPRTLQVALGILSLFVVGLLLLNRTALRHAIGFKTSAEHAVVLALSEVRVRPDTLQFVEYDDRDNHGLQYLPDYRVSGRYANRDINSHQVWGTYLEKHAGSEVFPLMRAISAPNISTSERCGGLCLLRHSLVNSDDSRVVEEAIGAVAGYLDSEGQLQDAVIDVIDAVPGRDDVKWQVLSPYLHEAAGGRFSSVLRVIWQWVPASEKAGTSEALLDCFERTQDRWTACNAMYALRKLCTTDILPALHEATAETPAAWKAWYCARLIEDLGDREAGPALRSALKTHWTATHYRIDIARILYNLDREASLPFICELIVHSGSDSIVDDFTDSYVLGRGPLMRGLATIASAGDPQDRQRARVLIHHLGGEID